MAKVPSSSSTSSSMHWLVLIAMSAMLAGACGSEIDSDASAIWDLSNNELHRIHGLAFANGAQPSPVSTQACAQGGSVEMTLSYVGDPAMENLSELLHVFSDCVVDGTTMSGHLDYLGVSFCDDGTPSFGVNGELSLTGGFETSCAIEGAELCGKPSGTVCGEKAK